MLRQVDLLILAHDRGRRLTDEELHRLRENQLIWRRDLDKFKQRLASATIEPPTRVQ
jgi:hypothetical protein